jgi:5-methylcytosine-specific restriction endonuclease McrBC regulatory subunit McrC
VEKIVGFGVAKGYQTRTRPPYPGVPDATAHLARYLGRPDRLITRARRLTSDIPVNQALAVAHRVLRGHSYADPAITVQLRTLGPVFTQIATVTDPLPVARAAVRHAATRYREALALAVLVLAGQTTLPTGTGTAGSSVLFNMTKIWEDYAQTWVQRRLPAGHRLAIQHPIVLKVDESRMTASADLVEFEQNGHPTTVYDAKYKPWGQTPSTGDLYQVVTYAHHLGVNRVFLLYPGSGEHSEVIVGRCRVAMLGIHVLNTPPEPDLAQAVPAVVSGTMTSSMQ